MDFTYILIANSAASVVAPDWVGLAIASIPLWLCAAILTARRLGQVKPLLTAAARLVAQVVLLGVVLEWIFANPSPATAIGVCLAMLTVSALTVGSRGTSRRRSVWGLRIEAFLAIAIASLLTMTVGIRLALHVEPWYTTRTIIPLIGMVLGNSVHGVALAAERLESELKADRDRVETRIALGATARQAALPALRAAVKAGLTPTINSMMIAGVVSIPGMMTGQILAGSEVAPALRYQIMIYFLIVSTVCLGVLIVLRLRLRRYFTVDHRLRVEMLDDRDRSE